MNESTIIEAALVAALWKHNQHLNFGEMREVAHAAVVAASDAAVAVTKRKLAAMASSPVVYRGYSIEPKRDMPKGGCLSQNGKVVKSGFVVVKDSCNAMPGATWFETVDEAKKAINVLIRVKGDATKFWEIMQPFEYTHIGQKADIENGEVRKGRFKAIIENFRVVRIFKHCKGAY